MGVKREADGKPVVHVEAGWKPAVPVREDDLLMAFSTAVFLGPERELAEWCAGVFWVITAHNPGGNVRAAAANQADDVRMQASLEGLERLPLAGCSPDLSHREDGWAVRFPSREAAVDLARRFGQRAVYEVRGGELWLIDLEGKWPVHPVGGLLARLRGK